jgi:6-phosphogluconolactonase
MWGSYDVGTMKPWDRRSFLLGAAVAPLMARALWSRAQDAPRAAAPSYLMFVGTQTASPSTSEGIYACRFNPVLGSLTGMALAAQTPNPTFLAFTPDKKMLVAANEVDNYVDAAAGGGTGARPGEKTGGVSSFKVKGAELTYVNTVSAHGAATCHVAVDQAGLAVFAANYTGGSAASFRLGADGRLSEAVSQFHYQGHGPVADRQEAAHAHRVTVSPENRFVFVNDLGLDCLHIYRLDWATATLTPAVPPELKLAPGSGPRALRFHPTGPWVYCVNELTSTIDVFGWNQATGQFTSVQKLELLPGGFKGVARASELVFDRSGLFGYAAVRDSNFLATLMVHPETGRLTLVDRADCGGKTPRHIALDPSEKWLLVANQDSDVISAVPRDAISGKLGSAAVNTALSKPQCLLFA